MLAVSTGSSLSVFDVLPPLQLVMVNVARTINSHRTLCIVFIMFLIILLQKYKIFWNMVHNP